jgi:mevalonate kinase
MRVGAASGKAILFGEHAVVYGVPALAVGLDRGARAEARPLAEGPSTLSIRGWQGPIAGTPVARAFADLMKGSAPFAVSASADLPPGGGLGCSAALGVAIARAVDPDGDVAERAAAWERVFHGNPSGVDAAVAMLGGCLLFERGTPSGVPKRLAPITRIRLGAPLHLCVGHSGNASSTKSMVDAVARLHERRPETTKKTFDAIHTLVKNARLALEAGDARAVGQLLDLNQMLLSGLFVSTPEIEQMCATARAAGALGAKLTGAGGGGCVIALVASPSAATAVIDAWKKDGFDGFFTTAGGAPPARAHAMEAAP